MSKIVSQAHVAERSKAADSRSAGGNPARVRISSCALFCSYISLLSSNQFPLFLYFISNLQPLLNLVGFWGFGVLALGGKGF